VLDQKQVGDIAPTETSSSMPFSSPPILTLGIACMMMPSFMLAQAWEQGEGTEGLNMQGIHFHDGWAYSGGATGTYHSNDEGATYSEANIGNTSIGPTRGFTHDDTYVYMCSSNGVFRSDNAGSSWVSVDNGLPQLLSHGMAASNDRLWVVTPSGAYTSTDHGDNWIPAGLDGLDVRCITILDNVAYVGTQGQGLFRSSDNGANWEAINNGTSSNTYRAIEAHGSTLFAAGGIGSGIFRSMDQGANWTLLSGGLPGGTFRGFATLQDWIVAGSFGNGVYVSNDNGDSWTGLNEGLGGLTIFDADFSATHLLVATDEAGAWRLPINTLEVLSGVSTGDDTNDTCFPNPAVHTIRFGHSPENETFQAWDITGRRISNGRLTQQSLDISRWLDGQYVIRIGETQTFRFTVQRP